MPSHEGKAVEGKTEPDDRESEARGEDETAQRARRPKGRGAQKENSQRGCKQQEARREH
jgi:hypothetical protein